MGLEAAEAAIAATDFSKMDSGAASPEQSSTTAEPRAPTTTSDLVDLDKLEKVRWGGKEWSRKDLDDAVMMRKTFTQKTQELAQERESFTKDKDYLENLPHDLYKVSQNPKLADEFRRIYPEKYHSYLDIVQAQAQQQPKTETEQQVPQLDPKLMTRLEKIESQLMEKEVETISSQIDAAFSKLKEKYPWADEESVIARAQTSLEARTVETDKAGRITENGWDSLFKSVQERNEKLSDARYKQMVEKQKQASSKAKDIGKGGETTGMAPAKSKSPLKDAEKAFLDSVAGMRF